MAYEWIKAPLALRYAACGEDHATAKQEIMERAHAGLIAAKAQTLSWGESEQRSRPVPQAFWGTDENDNFFEDWERGDFARCVEGEIDAKLFGVSFDFLALSDLLPAHKQAEAMRLISVASNPDWISAKDLQTMLFSEHNPAKVESAIVEACQLGLIAGRASRMKSTASSSTSRLDPEANSAFMEWDIPLWFWREFVRPDHFQDWSLNKAHGDGSRNKQRIKVELQGVHFHRSGLVSLGLSSPESSPSDGAKRGRRPTYDWPAASVAIFGLIHRGDFKPENQADVECALIEYLSDGESGPSESTVRPYARRIWLEAQKA